MATAKIYVIHHDAEHYPAFSSDVVTPILAGTPTRKGYRIEMRDTDTSENKKAILDVEKQDLYSEFTALYYVWQNNKDKANRDDIVGFMHYRSFLNLCGDRRNLFPSIDSCFGYDEASLKAYMSQGIPSVDVNGIPWSGTHGVSAIVSPPLDFDTGIYNQFNNHHPLGEMLFKKAKEYLNTNPKFQYLANYYDEHFSMGAYANKPQKGFFKCLFICTWEYFNAYCDFLFFVLDSLYNDNSVMSKIKKYSMIKGPDRPETQKKTRYRLLAFFAERLTSLFIAASIADYRFRVGTAPISHYTKMSDLVRQVYPTYIEKDLVPLMRVFSMENEDHMVVTKYEDLDSMTSNGYFFEGLLGYIYRSQINGTTPLYGCSFAGNHFCSQTVPQPDAICEDVLGYTSDVPNQEKNETISLLQYRMYGFGLGDYLTTNSLEEVERLRASGRGIIEFDQRLGFAVDLQKK